MKGEALLTKEKAGFRARTHSTDPTVQNGVKPFRTKDFFASGTSLIATTLSIPTFPFLTTQRPSTATRWTK